MPAGTWSSQNSPNGEETSPRLLIGRNFPRRWWLVGTVISGPGLGWERDYSNPTSTGEERRDE